jgi:quinol monooxygenase YgiN
MGLSMVLEIATVDIKSGAKAEFEASIKKALPILENSEGCTSARVQRSIERSNRYWILVDWESVDHHMIHFRESEGYKKWRAHVAPFLENEPQIEHTEHVASAF